MISECNCKATGSANGNVGQCLDMDSLGRHRCFCIDKEAFGKLGEQKIDRLQTRQA